MGRPGVTSGKGGRNYRLNWTEASDGGATFGDWRIKSEPGWRLPWEVRFKDRPFLRRHGDYNGTLRFKTVENAKRYVEKYIHTRRTRYGDATV
jgi:hypothetical protein